MTTAPKAAILSPQTLVPLGVLGVLLLVPVSGYIWLDARFDEVRTSEEKNFADLSKRADVIEQNLSLQNKAMLDRWTLSNQTVWYLEAKQKNPSLNLPDPRSIVKGDPTP